jgi:hypothetical protein
MFPSEAKRIVSEADNYEMVGETEAVQKYSKQRSWKPALETIEETSSRP